MFSLNLDSYNIHIFCRWNQRPIKYGILTFFLLNPVLAINGMTVNIVQHLIIFNVR